jgi:hypothetical protein
MDLDHAKLKADLEGAQRALGITLRRDQKSHIEDGRVVRARTLEAKLPQPASVCASFVREGWIERAKKLFVDEVEVGSCWFDDLVYVVTSTNEATTNFLSRPRVQQALILLVDETRHVEVARDMVRVVDEDARDDGRDASAELLALAAHLR